MLCTIYNTTYKTNFFKCMCRLHNNFQKDFTINTLYIIYIVQNILLFTQNKFK